MKLTAAQRRGLSLLGLIVGNEWKGQSSRARLSRRTSAEFIHDVTIESRVAYALKAAGLAHLSTHFSHPGCWPQYATITPAGRAALGKGGAK